MVGWNYLNHILSKFDRIVKLIHVNLLETTMGVALDKMDRDLVDQYKNAVRDMGYVVSYR